MKTITPESAKELTDSLADKNHAKIGMWRMKHEDHSVLIGDILEKIEDLYILSEPQGRAHRNAKQDELVRLWRKCVFTKDLQTILAEGMEYANCQVCGIAHKHEEHKVLKPEVSELFVFIKSLKL